MRQRAPTPEDLETLFEDALTLGDPVALAALFDEDAVLIAGNAWPAHGDAEIVRLALAVWAAEHCYIAAPLYVVQARDLALVVGTHGINVARRGRDGGWRYAIVFTSINHATKEEAR